MCECFRTPIHDTSRPRVRSRSTPRVEILQSRTKSTLPGCSQVFSKHTTYVSAKENHSLESWKEYYKKLHERVQRKKDRNQPYSPSG